MSAQPAHFLENDTEIEKVVRAARYLAEDGLSQKEIATRMKVHASTISRWLDRAQTSGILQRTVVVPRGFSAAEKLQHILEPYGVRRTEIVPSGPDRNIENLGERAAEVLLDTIKLVDDQKAAGPIRIVFACGATVMTIIHCFIRLLENYIVSQGNNFNHRVFEIYPSTLYGGSQLRATYPHMAVIVFTVLTDIHIPKSSLEIKAFAPLLPENFYKRAEAERQEILSDYHIQPFIDKIRKKADIFVMGVGTTRNKEYEEILQNMYESADPQYTAEMLYIPVDINGNESKRIAKKVVGITIDNLRQIAKDKNRHIIVTAGGESKRSAMQAVIRNPAYTALITDLAVAEEAILEHARSGIDAGDAPQRVRGVGEPVGAK